MKVIQRQQQQQQQRQRRSRILPSILRYGFAVALGMTLQTLFLSSSSFDSVQQQEMAAATTTTVVSNDFFTTTTTTRPSGTADASTRTINPTTREEDSTTTFDCQSYLLEILQRQDCFRQRMSQEGVLRNNGNNNNTDCCQSGRGTKTKSTNMHILPFHNYAGYHGQGFGRIVEHTVLSCLFATMILQRPCTLDFDSYRDVYWTWRSFINVNTFNWDWTILSTKQRHDIIHTLQTNLPLPLEKSDEWPNNNNNNILNNSQVLPLKWNNNNNNNKTLEDHLNEWKAGTSNNNNKILVSPNWGNDWYRHVPLSNLINEATHGQCKFNKFRTVLQNSMYAPTSLSKTLHQERIHRLLVPSLLLSPKKKKEQQQPQQQDQPQQPEDGYKYGAIHLRSILSDASIRMDYSISHPEIVNALSQCLLKATRFNDDDKNNISVWWIIGDNRTIAEHMKQSLQERHHYSAFNNNNSWQFVLEDDDNFWNALMHSGHAMKQRYHQEQMASSMMDFMVLHESTIAIVSHGAFGSTGARGNGKVKVQSCAPHQMFSIYSTSTTTTSHY